MNARRNGFASRSAIATIGAAALVLAALVAVIGSAQAAPSTKLYDASVRVTGGQVVVPEEQHSATSATLRLTLTNKGKQTLGSADFDPPSGVTPSATVFVASRTGWTARFEDGVVKFRSATALTKDQDVWADVPVTNSDCTDAAWTTEAKQSNDFSGQPGNSFLPGVLDLTPLASFDIATIETVTDDEQHVPAILTGEAKESTTTAYDLCGNVKESYSGATRSSTLLTGAGYAPLTGLNWEEGVGTVSITPVVTETDNSLTVTDGSTGVSDTSNPFDTTDRLCTSTDTDPEPCEWSEQGGKVTVNAEHPPESASLGIGFNSSLSISCEGATETVGDTPLININPRFEETEVEAIPVTITYKKSATGSGPASDFDVCFRKDEETSWRELTGCGTTPAAPCILSQKRVTGGDLEIVLWIATDDPWTGLT